MELRILGTGGFSNDGSPYNAFMINGHVLVETPPDILQSLGRASIDLSDIDTLIISHFHGDHCFGLPFFLFNLFLRDSTQPDGPPPLRLLAPPGAREWMKRILGLAISPDHPYVNWALSCLEIVEIGESRRFTIPGGLWLEFLRTYHSPETFSIQVGREGEDKPDFIATSDTSWNLGLEALLKRGAKLMLCDSGGEKPGGVHMSPAEIRKHILPKLPGSTRLLATHYSGDRVSEGRLEYARAGGVYRV